MDTPLKRSSTAELHRKQLITYEQKLRDNSKLTLLIGDSILERLDWYAERFESFPPHVAMLAKGGDTTAHLLWRLDNNEDEYRTSDSDKISKVILCIGTNNLKKSSQPQDIAECIGITITSLRRKFPLAHITVLPLYHRQCNAEKRKDVSQALIDDINSLLHNPIIQDDTLVTIDLDFWNNGILTAGRFEREEFEDHVHMNRASYDKFADKLLSII